MVSTGSYVLSAPPSWWPSRWRLGLFSADRLVSRLIPAWDGAPARLWGLTTKDALDRGIFNFDSLWYHLPFAVDMVQSHSVIGMHYVDTVFTNWFYPQNSELLHAVGIAIVHRDTLRCS